MFFKKVLIILAGSLCLIFGIRKSLEFGVSSTYWEGYVPISSKEKMKVILTVSKNWMGSSVGKITLAEKQLFNHRVSTCRLTDDSLSFAIADANPEIKFQGFVKGDSVDGDWKAGFTVSKITFLKVDGMIARLEEANGMIRYAKENSLYKGKVNWDSLNRIGYFALDEILPDSALSTTYIRLLTVLKDSHAGFIYKCSRAANPYTIKIKRHSKFKLINYLYLFRVSALMLEKDIAYIRIPIMTPLRQEDVDNAAARIQKAICSLNYNKNTNWIIDLRGNNGGNFNAMIAGIGNLVGNGEVGYFVKDSINQELRLTDKGFFQNGKLAARRSSENCSIQNYHPRIAVIIGGGTSSAGEDICIALMGRPDTKFFGELTRGLVSVTSFLTIDSEEDSRFILATSGFKDRTGKTYLQAIKPDVELTTDDDFSDLKHDGKILAAIKWLKMSTKE